MAGGTRVASKPRREQAIAAFAIGALTLLALVLRLRMMDQALFGDELYTYEVAIQDTLNDVFSSMRDTEANPPLYYLLSWVAVNVVDSTWSIRLPALAFGTASVPLIYLLGLRVAGRAGAFVAAALLAIAPTAIFYSSEGRAYAALMLFVCLSTYALLRALDDPRLRWWGLFAVATAAALYSHYTAIFPLAAQFAWALWARPGRRRETILAHAAAGLMYLPWLPYVRGTGIGVLGSLSALTPEAIARNLVGGLAGHPFVPLERSPGNAVLVLLGVGVAAATVALVIGRRERGAFPAFGRNAILFVALALAAPIGVVLYSALGTNILLARNMLSSLPALLVLLGWLLVSIDRRVALPAMALVVVALSIGTVKTLGSDLRRPPYERASEYLDEVARPADPIIEFHPAPEGSASAAFFPFDGPFDRHFELNLSKEHRLLETADPRARLWRRVDREPIAFVVMQWLPSFRKDLPAFRRLRLTRRQVWNGSIPVAVLTYTRTR